LAAALLSVAAQRRWIRHCRLRQRPSELRNARRLQEVPGRCPRPRLESHHRTRLEPHVRSTSVVSASSSGALRLAGTRLLRLEPHRPAVSGRPDYLPRSGALELDLGPGCAGVLLASLLSASAGLELRQSGRLARDVGGAGLLARPWR